MKRKTIVLAAVLFVVIAAITAFAAAFPLKYKNEVERFSEKYSVDESLVYAVIKAESNFRPERISDKGAIGLMQIMPDTAEYIGKEFYGGRKFDLFKPSDNIEAGCFYLAYLTERFSDLTATLAAYNAGEGNVRLWLKRNNAETLDIDSIPFEETRKYVKKVKFFLKVYRTVV